MHKLLTLLLCALPLQAADLSLTNGQRIAFVGDSFTQPPEGRWADYIRTYLILRNPTLTLHLQEVGRSGITLEQMFDTSDLTLYRHYSKIVYPLEPDYVIMLSISNGGYSKANYKTHQNTLIEDYIKTVSGAAPLVIGVPPNAQHTGQPTFDEYNDADAELAAAASPNFTAYHLWNAMQSVWTTGPSFTADSGTDVLTSNAHGFTDGTRVLFEISGSPAGPAGISSGTYYYVRDATANTFQVAATEGGAAVDITSNGSGTSYVSSVWPRLRYGANNFHHSAAANIIFAQKAIVAFGWGTDVSAATIAANTLSVTTETQCDVTNVVSNAYGGINFSKLDNRLEWAVDESGRADAELLFPDMIGWQSRTLTVSGLSAGTYDIYEDGVDIGDKTATELAAGVNLTLLRVGPTYNQVQEVLGRIRDMQGLNRTTLAEIASPSRQGVAKYKSAANGSYIAGNTGAALITDMSDELAEIASYDDLINDAAQPVNRAYQLRLQGYTPAGATVTSLNITNLTVGP